MMRYIISAAVVSALIGSASAGEFDESLCVSQASGENFSKPESLCSCLAEKSASDDALSAELALLQSQSSDERAPSDETADAIAMCDA